MLALGLCSAAPAQGVLNVKNPAALQLDFTGAYAQASTFQANDPVLLRQFDGAWAGPYTPRGGNNPGSNLALHNASAEVGVQWGRPFNLPVAVRLATLQTGFSLMEFNRDTADLARQNLQKLGYDLGRTYAIDYHLMGHEASGIKAGFAYAPSWSGPWTLKLGASVASLKAQRLKLSDATGQVTTLTTKDFNANVQRSTSDSALDQYNLDSFNAPFGRHTNPAGAGFTTEFGFTLAHATSGLSLDLAISDLWGSIHWSGVPRNAEAYNTATKYFDSSGYVQFNPTSTRVSSFQDFEQRLDPRLRVALKYSHAVWDVEAATSMVKGYNFPELSLGYAATRQWRMVLAYEPRFQTFAISVQYKNWLLLELRTDNADLEAARAMGLRVVAQIPFN